MTIRGTSVIGLPIITIKTGEKLQDVEDIIYDPRENKVKALLVSGGGLFSDAKVILVDQLRSIGKDAVIIENSDLLKNTSDVETTVSHIATTDTYLTKTKVLTDTGTDLGHIVDLFFDEHTGVVTEFEVSKGLVDTIQSGKKKFKVTDIETIGKDATIVKASTKDTFNDLAKEQGLTGAVETTKEKVPDVMEKAQQKLSHLGEKAKEKTQELTTKVKDKTHDIEQSPQMNQVKEKAQQVQQHIKQSAEKTQQNVQKKMQDTPQPSSSEAIVTTRTEEVAIPRSGVAGGIAHKKRTKSPLTERQKRDKEVKEHG